MWEVKRFNIIFAMKKLTFEQAYTRLKEIHASLQDNEVMDVEKIIALQKEAKVLYDQLDEILKKAEAVPMEEDNDNE